MSKSKTNPLHAMGRSPLAIGVNVGMKASRGVLLPATYAWRGPGAFIETLAHLCLVHGIKSGKNKGFLAFDELSDLATAEKAKSNSKPVPATSAGGSNSIPSHLGGYAEAQGYNYEIRCVGQDVMDVASYYLALWHCTTKDPRQAVRKPRKARKVAKVAKVATADVVQLPQAKVS